MDVEEEALAGVRGQGFGHLCGGVGRGVGVCVLRGCVVLLCSQGWVGGSTLESDRSVVR